MISKAKWFKSFRLKQIEKDLGIYLDNLKNNKKWIEIKNLYAKNGIKIAYKFDNNIEWSLVSMHETPRIPSIIFYNENQPYDCDYVSLKNLKEIVKTDELVYLKLYELDEKINNITNKFNTKDEFVILSIFSETCVIYKDKDVYMLYADFPAIAIANIQINQTIYDFLKQNQTVVCNVYPSDDTFKLHLCFKSNYLLKKDDDKIQSLPIKLNNNEYVAITSLLTKKDGDYILDNKEFINNLKIRLDTNNNITINNLVIKEEQIIETLPKIVCIGVKAKEWDFNG